MVINRCVLTGENGVLIKVPIDSLIIDYTTRLTGKVVIAKPVLLAYKESSDFNHPELAAMCRNAQEQGIEPPTISADFLNHTLKTLQYPKTFNEKVKHFLKLLYNKGGNDYQPIDLESDHDYTMAYAKDGAEFNRVMNYLHDKYWIKWGNYQGFVGSDTCFYRDVLLTDFGIAEVEKELPKVPMLSLVNQDISTGDASIDEKINHAKKLFFSEPSTINNMRSACESLCFVLEPLRDDLTTVITSADVNELFLIVNRFDIRHNKASTKNLVYPEQLEWVFYSLLNTINAYYKLKKRLQP